MLNFKLTFRGGLHVTLICMQQCSMLVHVHSVLLSVCVEAIQCIQNFVGKTLLYSQIYSYLGSTSIFEYPFVCGRLGF